VKPSDHAEYSGIGERADEILFFLGRRGLSEGKRKRNRTDLWGLVQALKIKGDLFGEFSVEQGISIEEGGISGGL
jgi:hypothetical protein